MKFCFRFTLDNIVSPIVSAPLLTGLIHEKDFSLTQRDTILQTYFKSSLGGLYLEPLIYDISLKIHVQHSTSPRQLFLTLLVCVEISHVNLESNSSNPKANIIVYYLLSWLD